MHGEPITAQSLTLLDQVARTISHHGFDARFRGFANRMLWLSPVAARRAPRCVMPCSQDKPYYPVAMVADDGLHGLHLLPLLMISGVPTLQQCPPGSGGIS